MNKNKFEEIFEDHKINIKTFWNWILYINFWKITGVFYYKNEPLA